MTADNAFFHRGPIRDTVYFFGREAETAQTLSLLRNGQSVAVVGQRRIGKTSLLFHLATPDVFQAHGLNPAQHVFVYLDCGGWSNIPPAELYQYLLEELSDALPPDVTANFQPPPPVTYRAFERSLRRLVKQGWRPIFLFDEFERLSLNPALDPDFFSGLRALTARYPVAYVTASKAPLLELTYANASALSSPFFNIFAAFRLGLFRELTARELLVQLAARSSAPFSEPLLDFLVELAGPHPLFLQIAGFHAVELIRQRNGPLSDSDMAELQRRVTASVTEHYSYYWRNLSPEAQRMLVTLPAAQCGHPDQILHLAHDCLIRPADGGFDYLSPLWRDFAQAQPVEGLIQAGPIAIDRELRQVFLRGATLELTPTQYDLLLCLVAQAGQVLAIEALEQAIWGDEYIDDPERLKSVLKGLRRALGDAADRLENVRGIGYVWRG
jgi:DNA-binding response OmpR family regulator